MVKIGLMQRKELKNGIHKKEYILYIYVRYKCVCVQHIYVIYILLNIYIQIYMNVYIHKMYIPACACNKINAKYWNQNARDKIISATQNGRK